MKESIENLLPFERDLFFALNGSDSLFLDLDNVFWTFTGRYVWILLWIFLLVMFFYRTHRREGILAAVFFILVIVVCDQVSSSVIKEIFQRLRPTRHPDFKDMVDMVNGYRGGGFSFVSGHATNSFGLAVLLSLIYKNRWVTIPVLVWATLNSYSRIYLGVHFVSDVLGGIIVGSLLAWLLYQLYVWIRARFYHIPRYKSRLSVYSTQSSRIVGFVISVYTLLIIIFSPFLATLPH